MVPWHSAWDEDKNNLAEPRQQLPDHVFDQVLTFPRHFVSSTEAPQLNTPEKRRLGGAGHKYRRNCQTSSGIC